MIQDFQKNLIGGQVSFWRDGFRVDITHDPNFKRISFPYSSEFARLIVQPYGITPNIVWEKCKKLFPCWEPNRSFESGIWAVQDHHLHRMTARLFKDKQKASEYPNMSSDDLERQGVMCMTLTERLIYEILYFEETGDRLDKNETWTICSGSRYPDGDVPVVFSQKDVLNVAYISPTSTGGNIAFSREARGAIQ